MQVEAPEQEEKLPTTQALHTVAAEPLKYVPLEQFRQLELPDRLEKVPLPH